MNIIYCCMDCGNQICKKTALDGKGRCLSCSSKGKLSSNWKNGKTTKKYFCKICKCLITYNTANFGKGHCVPCAGVINAEQIIGENNLFFGKHHSLQNKEQWSKNRQGKLSNNWRGGISKFLYPLEFLHIKETIRKRDNFTCQCCCMTENKHLAIRGTVLNIHHIDYDKNKQSGIQPDYSMLLL